MSIKACIFDCDGTILNTLPDMVAITNMTLERMGYPQHSTEEVESYVGNGARKLIERALPTGVTEETVDTTLKLWRDLYPEYGMTYTAPYEGMQEVLDELKRIGIKLAVLSNKFDLATQAVVQKYYPGTFDIVHGEREGVPRKPDPKGLLLTMEELGVSQKEVLYIGDSVVDTEVAKKAGCCSVNVDWGYNSIERLQEARPDHIIHTPHELLSLL